MEKGPTFIRPKGLKALNPSLCMMYYCYFFVFSSQADVEEAVKAAKAAFKRGSTYRNLNASARGRLLYKLSDLIERDQTLIAVSLF